MEQTKVRMAVCLYGSIYDWKYTKYGFVERLIRHLKQYQSYDIFVRLYTSSKTTSHTHVNTDLDGISVTHIETIDINHALSCQESVSKQYSHMEGYMKPVRLHDIKMPRGTATLASLYSIEALYDMVTQYEDSNFDENEKYTHILYASLDTVYSGFIHLEASKQSFQGIEITSIRSGYPFFYGDRNSMDKIVYKLTGYLSKVFNTKAIIKIPQDKGVCKCEFILPCCKFDMCCILSHIADLNQVSSRMQYSDNIRSLQDCLNATETYSLQIFPRVSYINDMDRLYPPADSNIVMVTNAMRDIEQTLNTMKSIRENIPDSYIILLEARYITREQIIQLYNYADFIVLYNIGNATDKEIVDACSHKSLGEVYKIYRLLKHIPFGSHRIFKLTGRYVFNDKFDIQNYTVKNKICAWISDDDPNSHTYYNKDTDTVYSPNVTYAMNTSFYSVDANVFVKYYSAIVMTLGYLQDAISKNKNEDIEHMLYKFIDKSLYRPIDVLGVEGRVDGRDLICM